MSARIAITGANGFVGAALSRLLLGHGFDVVGVVRPNAVCEPGVVSKTLDSLSSMAEVLIAQDISFRPSIIENRTTIRSYS